MIVKFIQTAEALVFGNKSYILDLHADVAYENRVEERKVEGGGIADLKEKRIYGTSYGFGPYNAVRVRALLPDWSVEEPSDGY